MTRVRVATWNIHAGVGLDRRFDPDRIARVIEELDADVVALQEFTAPRGFDLAAHLEGGSGWKVITMPTWVKRGSDFGNAIISRLPIAPATQHALAIDRREPRNAIDVVVDCSGTPLRVIATHLGLRASERAEQIDRLCRAADATLGIATVMLGDFNEWRLSSPSLAPLHRRFGRLAAPATFPSLRPLLALDRCWVDPVGACLDMRAHASRTARFASDHLPLVATLDLARIAAGSIQRIPECDAARAIR